MNPLLVGQAPSASAAPGAPPLSAPGGAGRRLAAILGLSDLRDRFDVVNLLDAFPGRVAGRNGDVFPLALARERAAALDVAGRPFVLLLGLNVARAFGVPPRAFEWSALADRRTRVAAVPHTSGVSRFYNDPDNRDRARRFVLDALDSHATNEVPR